MKDNSEELSDSLAQAKERVRKLEALLEMQQRPPSLNGPDEQLEIIFKELTK